MTRTKATAGWGRHLGVWCGVLVLAGCVPMLPRMEALDPTYRENPAVDAPAAAELVNERRAAAGCTPLVWHAPSARAAQAHSDDMAARSFFGHASPEGRRLGDRLREHGVDHRGAAENLARTPHGPRGAVQTWMVSGPHRANLLNCAYTHQGVGVRDGRWTQVLVTLAAGE